MNFCLERQKLSLTLLMLIIFYGTLDLVGWSSSLYLNNKICSFLLSTTILPPDLWWCLQGPVLMGCTNFPFKMLFSFSRCSWLGAWVQHIQFVLPAATTAGGAELSWRDKPPQACFPNPAWATFIGVSAGGTSAKCWLFCFPVLPLYCSVKTSSF